VTAKPGTAYVVADVFPTPDSDLFEGYAGAAAGCWVRGDLAGDEDADPTSVVRQQLADAGWQVAAILDRQSVSAESYADNPDGRQLFEQAQTDGVVVSLQLRRRERVGERGLPDGQLAAAFDEVSRLFARDGAYSLYSEADDEWANGVTEDGDEFVPLWKDWAGASRGIGRWPSYKVCKLTPDDLSSGLLPAIHQAEMWAGIGFVDGELIMFHPLQMKARIDGVGI
jgi:hypothetical protein